MCEDLLTLHMKALSPIWLITYLEVMCYWFTDWFSTFRPGTVWSVLRPLSVCSLWTVGYFLHHVLLLPQTLFTPPHKRAASPHRSFTDAFSWHGFAQPSSVGRSLCMNTDSIHNNSAVHNSGLYIGCSGSDTLNMERNKVSLCPLLDHRKTHIVQLTAIPAPLVSVGRKNTGFAPASL